MSEFSFKEIDEEGMETLKAISEANKFNEWMYERIAPDCSGKILEIGSGIGNISCLLYTSPSPRDQRGSRMPSSA